MGRSRRISISLSEYYYGLLSLLAEERGELLASTAAEIVKTKLQDYAESLRFKESSDKNLTKFLEVLVGQSDASKVDLDALSKYLGKPKEFLEALLEQHSQLSEPPCYLEEKEECECGS